MPQISVVCTQNPPGGLVTAALWVVGGVDGERDPLELYGGGGEGFVRREVVAISHAVKGRVQPSAAWSGPPVSNGIERGALEEPTQAKPGLEWATADQLRG